MRMIASPPSVMRDEKVLSLLRAEFQSLPANDPPTRAEVLALSAALAAEPSAVEDLLKAFRARHLSKTYRPGIRSRFDALMSRCPSVPAHHRAAAHFLITWRNRHVHGDYADGVARLIESDWQQGLSDRITSAVSSLQLRHVACDALVDPLKTPLHLGLGEVLIARIDSLEFGTIDCDARLAQQIKLAA